MAIVYKIKDDIDFNELGKLGWDIVPNFNNLIFFKIVEQPLDSELPQLLLKNFYKNPRWIKEIYNKNKKEIVKQIGLEYDKNGEIIMSEKFVDTLKTWMLELDLSDSNWIGFKNLDIFNKNVMYNCKILDKFCENEIKLLKENNLIEEYEVGDA